MKENKEKFPRIREKSKVNRKKEKRNKKKGFCSLVCELQVLFNVIVQLKQGKKATHARMILSTISIIIILSIISLGMRRTF